MAFDPFFTPDDFEEPEERREEPPQPRPLEPPPPPEPLDWISWAKAHKTAIFIGGGLLLYLMVFLSTKDNLSLVMRLWFKEKEATKKPVPHEVTLKAGKGDAKGRLFSLGPSASVTGDYQDELERALLKAVTVQGKIKRGERVIKALVRNGLARKEAERIVASFESRGVFQFRRAQPGNTFLVRMSPEGDRAYYFEYHFGPRITLVATRKRDGFSVKKTVKPLSTRLFGVVMVLNRGGLRQAARDADQDERLAAKLGVLMEEEIPTSRLAPGDRFELLVERTYIGKKPSGYGRILAARMSTRIRGDYEIFYFVQKGHGGSYYTADGLGFFRVFLPRPVQGEAPYDKDPYHDDGVLFPSGRGALVRSIGRGKIKWVGWKKSWGKMVVVEHPGGYETTYYYLSRHARLRPGQSVEKRTVLGRAGWPVLNPALTGVGFSAFRKGVYITPAELAKLREQSIEPDVFPEFTRTVQAYRNILKSLKKFKTSASMRMKDTFIPNVHPWDRRPKRRK